VSRTFRAAWVLPITSAPIQNGEVVVEDGRIVDVRPSGSVRDSSVHDLGDAILMPGLINCHTHLDYTVMRGLLEDIEFFPWIRQLTARKAALTAEDWIASATWGAAEALASGITTIGDCTDSGAAFDGANTLGLRGTIYQEVFGIDEAQTVENLVAELHGKVDTLQARAKGTRLSAGISPHAPYTVRPALMTALRDYAASQDLPVCIHAAESRAEAELMHARVGSIAAMFERRGIHWELPAKSTVAYLDGLGILSPRTLLVHGIQVSASDRHIVAERGVAWAHCPKSNAKLGNGVAPLGILGRRHTSDKNPAFGENIPRIGLGSDSVASNNTLDLFEEMRFAVLIQRGAHHRIAALTAREAVEMATVGSAKALGMEAEVGSLEAGKHADLCAVRFNALHSAPAYDPYNALVYAARASDVCLTAIGGEVLYDTSQAQPFARFDLNHCRRQFQSAARKMQEWSPDVIA
jgi:cytosine/adenosine deaminase-related metal-dependent hydrolase